MSKTRTLLTFVSALATLCFVSGIAVADPSDNIQASVVTAPAEGDLIPEPDQPVIEPGDDAESCPVREEDLGQDVSRVDTSYLPEAMIFGSGQVNQWGSGETCNMSLCCGDMHCQPPYVPSECASTCNTDTWICNPV